MAEVVENEEKLFEYYLDLPENARKVVIEQMEPEDRCRFTRCSKMSRSEAISSKNYIYELSFTYWREKVIIEVLHAKYELEDEIHPGFYLKFYGIVGEKYRDYISLANNEMWETELRNSADLLRMGITEFRSRLVKYQNSVKSIFIEGGRANAQMLRHLNFGVESLPNLEKLEVKGDIVIGRFFSKIQRPLKILKIDGQENNALLANCEQIHQVQQKFTWTQANFDYAQLQKLSAKNVHISIGQLNERDILRFIKSWQNGTIGKEIEVYTWKLYGSEFDRDKFMRLLRSKNETFDQEIEIKHYKQAGKSAALLCTMFKIEFRTIIAEPEEDLVNSSDSEVEEDEEEDFDFQF